MNFIHFDKLKDCEYPVGESFVSNLDYIKGSAEILHNFIEPDKPIQLICRGTSGTILAGAIGFILTEKGRDITIVVSRKTGNHHSHNMAGIRALEFAIPVVIDDFISDGDTLESILIDMDACLNTDIYPILCVSNFMDETSLKKMEERKPLKYKVINRFETIICNKTLART